MQLLPPWVQSGSVCDKDMIPYCCRHWKSEVGDKLGVKLQYYLDYTAAALFTKSHLAAVTQMLSSTTLSNPHSRNPSSARSTQVGTGSSGGSSMK
jgi:hypothetical protein